MATKAEWIARQHRLNLFTKKYLRGVGSIKADGVYGPSTEKRIKQAKWWLGWEKTDSKWTEQFHQALLRPRDSRVTSRGTVLRGIARRKQHNAFHWRSYLKPGVGTFDGVRVAKCAIPILRWCRAHDWGGHLVSGYRSPAYSEHLCYAMCGRPSCPGKCAGRASNHSGNSPVRFAVDVSDYATFKNVVARCPLKPHIHNNLPVDPVHFSPSGR